MREEDKLKCWKLATHKLESKNNGLYIFLYILKKTLNGICLIFIRLKMFHHFNLCQWEEKAII